MRSTRIITVAIGATALLIGGAPLAYGQASASGTSAAEAQAAARLDDATIVAIFDAANTADIETGELAAQRGSSKAVRDFGAQLVNDHRAVRQMGRDLAKKLGVTPTPPADDAGAKAHAAAMASLRATSGTEFDLAFLRHEVEFHAAVMDAVQKTLLPAIQNAELKALVEKVGPAFHAHMLRAEALAKQIAEEASR